nr:putative RNA-directed DNA polymerase [Tanacetum cinerariifolium]
MMEEDQPHGRRGGYARRQPCAGADVNEEEPRPNRREHRDLEIAAQERRIRELERLLAHARLENFRDVMREVRDHTSTQPRATMKKMRTHGGLTDPIEIAVSGRDVFDIKNLTDEQKVKLGCDVVEEEEETIARYLAALKPKITVVVQLQQYWSYNDVCRLARKVESQQKKKVSSSSSSRFSGRFTGSDAVKKVANPSSNPTRNANSPTSYNTTSIRRGVSTNKWCYKCQGLGHYANDCPNRQIVTLVEEDLRPVFDEYDNEYEKRMSDAEEITYADSGEVLVVRRSMSAVVISILEEFADVVPQELPSDVTPQEAWSGLKPTVEHFRVWGSLAHVHIPKEKRTKLANRSFVCVLTGVSEESKAYRLINPETMRVVISKDVIFEEDKSWNWIHRTEVLNEDEEISWGNYDFIDEDYVLIDEDGVEIHDMPEPNSQINDSGPSSTLVREGRPRRRPNYLQDYVTGEDLYSSDEEENEVNVMDAIESDPVRYEDAIKEAKWKMAMDNEIEMIEKNDTWRLVDLPNNSKCIGVKWVFKTKLNEKGEVEKYKARLVARGYGQEFGIDYMEVYAPVARMDTIRLMLALAAQNGWSIYQMDVKSAFLHGMLQEDVYVQQPQGYVKNNNEHKVYKLQKALYGLKQAPRAWYSRIEAYFIAEGFVRSKTEHTLFIKKQEKEKVLYVNIYVDDLLFTGNNERLMEDFKASMKAEFEMTDLGKMRYFLGIEVIQSSSGIHISQKKYAAEILTRFKMVDCNSVVNPIVPGNRLTHDGGEEVNETVFKQLVGSLMYMTTTRPDIQFVVSFISRFMAKPTETHLAAAKRVMRYLQGTLDYGIWYRRGGKGKMEIYADSDFAGDLTDRKSTSGYVILWDGAAVSWSSKKQSIVALSSTEAEYVAAASCACQVIWMREMLNEFGLTQMGSSVIKCDNTSAIQLSRNPVFHGRCKHIGVRFHFLRDLVNKGIVGLEYVDTREQVADIFTKPLHRDVFQGLRERLGVCSVKGKQDLETSPV